ncbi:hypothetical protein RF11_08860 [Thelohanellus kitauei]|uniref:ISXO2-like transposase domain-containing protein n=1 Tax=Thelohanellus kitauei TaxID=669202 RepID=A0A0C2MBN8_THEKT|nr:hypothetical protein RF11_08860 [Thelohanellus kitauei]
MEKNIIDWHNHYRIVCQNAKIAHFSSQRVLREKPSVVVQIDESLFRARRQDNRGRILAGNENISIEDRIEWRNMYRDIEEEQKRRNADTLLPIIREHIEANSMIWSDDWPPYRKIGKGDNLLHEFVNHSE